MILPQFVKVLQPLDDLLWDVQLEESIDPLPEVHMILDLLSCDHAIIFGFKEVVVFIIDKVVDSAIVLVCLRQSNYRGQIILIVVLAPLIS